MENNLENSNILKRSLFASIVCVVVCLACEIVILVLLELHGAWSGMSAMYWTMILATFLSSFLQTSYISIKHHESFGKVFVGVFLMVLVSMVGMALAEIFLHTETPAIHAHHAHESMENMQESHAPKNDKNYMYQAMITPFAIFLMLFGGLLTLIPYNYFRLKKYKKLH